MLSFELFGRLDRFDCRFRDLIGGPFGIYADELAATSLVLELYEALDQGEQRVVFALADVIAGLPLGSTLTSNDVAAEDVLSTGFLKAQPLCIRVAAVPG